LYERANLVNQATAEVAIQRLGHPLSRSVDNLEHDPIANGEFGGHPSEMPLPVTGVQSDSLFCPSTSGINDHGQGSQIVSLAVRLPVDADTKGVRWPRIVFVGRG
jgi:hypothetical protein